MRKLWKLVSIALCGAMLFTACGSNKASDTTAPVGEVEVTIDDKSEEAEIDEDIIDEAEPVKEESSTETFETDDEIDDKSDATVGASTEKTAETTESTKSENDSQSGNTASGSGSTGTTKSANTEKSAAAETTTEKPASTETTKKTTTEAATTHTHNWTPVYKTVVDQEAYDEKVPTGEYYTKLEKHKYGLAMVDTGDPFNDVQYAGNCGKDNHYIDITGWTLEEREAYEKEHNLYSLSSCYVDYIEVPDYDNPIYETVHHDAVTHQEVDYYKCSCGATK